MIGALFFPRLIGSIFSKLAEWGLATIMFAIGWGLLGPGSTFGYNGNLWPFLTVASEDTWGYVMIAVGAGSIMALYVNGESPKVTSAARIIFAAARSIVWLVSASVFLQAAFSLERFVSSAAIYPVFMLMDWIVIVRATWEHKNATRRP